MTSAEEASQLVVDTTHLDAVQQVLDELAITSKQAGSAHAFDLTLLALTYADGEEVSDLDPVLTEVRARIGGRSGGWIPLLGKNREMSSMFGAYPQTCSHALWDPDPTTKPDGWLTGDDGRGVRIGLLDTEIFDHPDIPDHAIEAVGFDKFETQEATVPYFEEGHGVFMAGLILQQAPGATLVARAALNGRGKASAWSVVKKLEQFYTDEPDERVQLLVLASGCRTYDGKAPLIIERAVERLSRRITVVAAAGNHGATTAMTSDLGVTRHSPTWPAALPSVIAAGLPTPFTGSPSAVSYGQDYSPDLPWVTCTVDPGPAGEFVSSYLAAPEVELKTGRIGAFESGFVSWRGTSCAAAQLGGVIAAKMAKDKTDAWTAFHALTAPDGDPAIRPYEWEYRKEE
ncbi:hypothetical protein UK23_39980 [Lentzea aerocolonigenes]|uniref:Peptidase S8/S53 domain-containing protein n=1 Tax=Lentzea aerocolonigenes TaxID=68170 RepID=A0A0F0GE71_LENAE|nr:S8/S53 family peptidase [Lentzea aerocolonigenes]KJK41255.1 hypothetical protein UK23_39980 [Lentzea aerocolonigenes]